VLPVACTLEQVSLKASRASSGSLGQDATLGGMLGYNFDLCESKEGMLEPVSLLSTLGML